MMICLAGKLIKNYTERILNKMANAKINYGTKKAVASYEPKVKDRIFLLADNAVIDLTQRYRPIQPTNEDDEALIVKKCFCSDCQSTFDVDLELEDGRKNYSSILELNSKSTTNGKKLQDIACPDCGAKAADGFRIVPKLHETTPKEGHINMSGAWRIPPVTKGRHLFEFDDDNGKPTRIEDNIMCRYSTVFPSGKSFSYDVEYSEVSDLMKNSIKVTKTKIVGNERTLLSTNDSIDEYKYPDFVRSFDKNVRYGIQSGNNIGTTNIDSVYCVKNLISNDEFANTTSFVPGFYSLSSDKDTIKQTLMSRRWSWVANLSDEDTELINSVDCVTVSNDIGRNVSDAYRNQYKTITNTKFKIIERRFDGSMDEVYNHSAKSRLLLAHHTVNASEENTELDVCTMSKYLQMMIKYPVALNMQLKELANVRQIIITVNFVSNKKIQLMNLVLSPIQLKLKSLEKK